MKIMNAFSNQLILDYYIHFGLILFTLQYFELKAPRTGKQIASQINRFLCFTSFYAHKGRSSNSLRCTQSGLRSDVGKYDHTLQEHTFPWRV